MAAYAAPGSPLNGPILVDLLIAIGRAVLDNSS
jgi:hypothetical protein